MIRLVYDVELGEADFGVAPDGGVEQGHELETAVVISLFTDRYIDESELPPGTTDRGGWWGDAYADEDGDQIGSRLWLLERGLDLPDAPVRARADVLEALQWMVDDGLAKAVDCTAERTSSGRIAIYPAITLTDGTVKRYGYEV